MSILGRKPLGSVAYLGGLLAVPEAFCWAWGALREFTNESLADDRAYVHFMRTTYSLHHASRNDLAARFLGDWLLQLDTDHVPDPDLVVRMLRLIADVEQDTGVQIQVLSGTYQFKGPPHSPVYYQWRGEGDNVTIQPIVCLSPDAKIIEIGAAGGGCLWVRRSVFDRMATELRESPFDLKRGLGEDISFFYRCRQLGIQCYAATQIESPHLTFRAITLSDIDTAGISETTNTPGFR